jgi:hypothetical protein
MLVLKRRDGDWLEVEHVASGDVIRIRTYAVQCKCHTNASVNRLSVACDDPDRNFEIRRPEQYRAKSDEREMVTA